ncbi:MAG: Nif11-like leader peptide family RiPP precursor [Defluviitaleaceae bacterium]|nr:Nif11-like leader peptide family RiPP precursor [Defluviitaleaceae bacterium]
MNREGMEHFFKLLSENPEYQDRVKSIGSDAEALAAYAKELGCEVSTAELREYQDKARELLKEKVQKKLTKPNAALSAGAQAFYDFMKLSESDTEVAKRLEELAAGTAEELIAYGKEKGFVFDRQDMLVIGNDILEPSDELSDDELELAAGGLVDVGLALVFVGCVLGLAAVGGVAVAGGAAAGGAAVGFVLALLKK